MQLISVLSHEYTAVKAEDFSHCRKERGLFLSFRNEAQLRNILTSEVAH